jgi:hypothetical protein
MLVGDLLDKPVQLLPITTHPIRIAGQPDNGGRGDHRPGAVRGANWGRSALPGDAGDSRRVTGGCWRMRGGRWAPASGGGCKHPRVAPMRTSPRSTAVGATLRVDGGLLPRCRTPPPGDREADRRWPGSVDPRRGPGRAEEGERACHPHGENIPLTDRTPTPVPTPPRVCRARRYASSPTAERSSGVRRSVTPFSVSNRSRWARQRGCASCSHPPRRKVISYDQQQRAGPGCK